MESPNGQNLTIAGGQATPEILADWAEGLLAMAGESYPENTYELFDQVISWVERYLEQEERQLRLDLRLNYLNTSSIRAMIDIFDLLQDAFEQGKPVEVQWLYDDRNPRSAELGEEFKEDYTFPFSIRALEV
ncbi:MAG: biofilm regulation phosphoprotein SiaC [Prochlorococcaceae cyanobacterium]|jgi:hypothetical protein